MVDVGWSHPFTELERHGMKEETLHLYANVGTVAHPYRTFKSIRYKGCLGL